MGPGIHSRACGLNRVSCRTLGFVCLFVKESYFVTAKLREVAALDPG